MALLLDRSWELSPRVAVRPEPFGALLYDYGTRRLTFLKDRRLLDVVTGLTASATAREACETAGVTTDELPAFGRALEQLASRGMLQERTS